MLLMVGAEVTARSVHYEECSGPFGNGNIKQRANENIMCTINSE